MWRSTEMVELAGGWVGGGALQSLVRLRTDQPERALVARAQEQIDLVTSLWDPAGDLTYALRVLAEPHAANPADSKLTVALLVRANEPERLQLALSELRAVIGGLQPDDQWRPLAGEELDHLLVPFSFDQAQVAAVVRRETAVDLNTLRARPGLSRGTTGAARATSYDEVYCVHPWTGRPSSRGRVLRTMMLSDGPTLLQVLLRPTVLAEVEEKALAADLNQSAEAASRQTTTRPAQAQALATMLHQSLVTLADSPFEVSVTLAAPERLPASLVETVGSTISALPGGEDGVAGLYRGGFDAVWPTTDEERAGARAGLAELRLVAWTPTAAGEGGPRLRGLMDAREAACAFAWPCAVEDGLPGIEVHHARQRPAGLELIDVSDQDGVLLGDAPSLGGEIEVKQPARDRTTHAYVVGQTGTGKTTLLKQMIIHDIQAGAGVFVIDPHGDLIDELLCHIPPERHQDVAYIDPADMDNPIGINLLAPRGDMERHFIVRELVSIFDRLLSDRYGHKADDYAGPTYHQHLQMNLLLAMSRLAEPGTLLEFYQIFQSRDYWRRWVPLEWHEPMLQRWVDSTLEAMDYTRRPSEMTATWGEYLSSKFVDFVFDPRLRLIFGQKRPRLDFAAHMNKGGIILARLAKGILSEANTRFLGMVLMAQMQVAAMRRVAIPPAERRPFFCYVDEFQALATREFAVLLSEARKFGVGLILANQYANQIDDPAILRSLLGNVGALVAFRLGSEDAQLLGPEFQPGFDALDLNNQANYHAAVRMAVHGRRALPFTLRTRPAPAPGADGENAAAVRRASAAQFGVPRAQVEAEIADSLEPPIDFSELR